MKVIRTEERQYEERFVLSELVKGAFPKIGGVQDANSIAWYIAKSIWGEECRSNSLEYDANGKDGGGVEFRDSLKMLLQPQEDGFQLELCLSYNDEDEYRLMLRRKS